MQQFYFWVFFQEKKKTLIQKDTYTPMFTAALFTTAKLWKQPKHPPTDEWIKKMWYTYIPPHTHNGMLAIKNKIFKTIFILYWSIVGLQWCVSYKCTAKWFIYISFYPFSNSFLIYVITEYWAEFLVLYKNSLLVIYFKYSSVYMSVPNCQSIPLALVIIKFLLYVCVSLL